MHTIQAILHINIITSHLFIPYLLPNIHLFIIHICRLNYDVGRMAAKLTTAAWEGETGIQITKLKRQIIRYSMQWEHGVIMHTVQVSYRLFAYDQPRKE